VTILLGVVVTPGRAGAADVQIENLSGDQFTVFLECERHKWEDMGAVNRKAVVLRNKRPIQFAAHPGNYRLFAMFPNRRQFSEKVIVDDREVNRFVITFSPYVGAPAGGGGSLGGEYNIYKDTKDKNEEGPDVPEPEPLPPPGEWAANLGITYERVDYSNGTFGAKLTEDPRPGSPAAQLRLEPGDIIFELDGVRFREPRDVLGHGFWTTMKFVNVRTGRSQGARVYIP
jgi:hypothetical protein